MTPAYRRLCAGLPASPPSGSLSIPLDPRSLAGWIAALPRANAQATLRQLEDGLRDLERVALKPGQRLELLELLRPAVLESIALLQRQLQGSALPLADLKLVQAEQWLGLHAALARGYRAAAAEHCAPAGKLPFLRGGQVALALHRALLHAAQALDAAFWRYSAPPAGLWTLLHAVYAFAQERELHAQPPKGADPADGSARHQILLALLFAAANPYRFAQREQAELKTQLAALADAVVLQTGARDGAIAVDPMADAGPGFVTDERLAEGGVLWLDVAPLRAQIEAALAADPAATAVHLRTRLGGAGARLTATHARRLLASWQQASARGHHRLPAGHTLDTVIGLTGLHYQLAGGLDFDAFLREVNGARIEATERERAAWTHAGSGEGARVPVQPARVHDQSLGGYRLGWDAGVAVRARVGELIGLALGDEPVRDWMVGLIRWLRYNGDGSVDAGVELLARRAQAVAVRSAASRGGERPALRGIRFDSLDAAAPSGLVLPLLVDPREGVEILAPASLDAFDPREAAAPQAQPVTAVSVVESTGDYAVLRLAGDSAAVAEDEA